LHDSGSRYIGKIYNDDWMIKNNFSLDWGHERFSYQ
jgi:hypothetical protein